MIFSSAYLALEQNEKNQFDYVLFNWQNKDFDAMHDLALLKQLAQRNSCKIIGLMTVLDREYTLNHEAQFHGLLDGYLIKPITKEMLFDIHLEQGLSDAHLQEASHVPRRLEHIRILLVEDNITNQQVARGITGSRRSLCLAGQSWKRSRRYVGFY